MSGALVVTGASRGIGAAVARHAARAGYAVCVNYTADEGAAARVVDGIESGGGRALAVRADVADAAGVRALFDAAGALGPLAGLVNNAGITGPLGTLAEVDPAVVQRVLDVNVIGSLLCAREAVRRLSTARGGRGGAIVNLSSGAATLGSPGEYVWYAASKGAIDTLTTGLSKEVAAEGIRVNAVSPGLVDTEIHAAAGDADRARRMASGVPMGRVGTAQEVAEAVLWLLSDAAAYVTGANLRVAGGR